MRNSTQRAAEVTALKKLISALIALCAALIGSSTAWSGPLHDAIIDGDVDEVERLIAQGADVNEEDFAAGLPLHLAIAEAHKTIAELLIASGADVNAEDFELGTPLHIVASEGDVDMAELLILSGADVDGTDSDGSTPLHIAARLGRIAVVDFLVNSGADPDVVNDDGIIPLQAAAEEGEAGVIEALIAGGATVPTIEPVSPLLTSASVDDGERVAQACTECHTVEKGGPNVYGPNLWGIVGSPKAVREGFNYSSALIEVGGVWSYEDLNTYLANPALFAPGTSMLIDPLDDVADRANFIAYLRQSSDEPPALPKQ